MIGKIVFWLVFLITLGALAYQVYQELPAEPVQLLKFTKDFGKKEIVDYGDTPVFAKNLRFNHKDISYNIDSGCSSEKRKKMLRAFRVFESTFNGISFFKADKATGDILVGCSDEFIDLGSHLFTAGEGGPSKIINAGQFNLIEQGKISLYRKIENCDYPIVELHELLHVFGFDHTQNPKSIMYNVSSCDQRITPDMVEIMDRLYSFEALPDLVMKNLSVIQRGRYLDFNVTILNEGLLESPDFKLSIVIRGREIESFYFDETDVGFGRTIRAVNVRLPSRNVETIKFVIDRFNSIREFDEENNVIQVRAKT